MWRLWPWITYRRLLYFTKLLDCIMRDMLGSRWIFVIWVIYEYIILRWSWTVLNILLPMLFLLAFPTLVIRWKLLTIRTVLASIQRLNSSFLVTELAIILDIILNCAPISSISLWLKRYTTNHLRKLNLFDRDASNILGYRILEGIKLAISIALLNHEINILLFIFFWLINVYT